MQHTKKFISEFNEYNNLMKRLGSKTKTLAQYEAYRAGKMRRSSSKKSTAKLTTYKRESPKIPSGDTYDRFTGTKKEKQYTGDKLLGIATMHKSNLVPVFRQEDAEDIARMRR